MDLSKRIAAAAAAAGVCVCVSDFWIWKNWRTHLHIVLPSGVRGKLSDTVSIYALVVYTTCAKNDVRGIYKKSMSCIVQYEPYLLCFCTISAFFPCCLLYLLCSRSVVVAMAPYLLLANC